MAVPGCELSVLTCPSCGQSVTYRDGVLLCTSCSETVPVVDGIPRFPVAVDHPSATDFFDILAPIYETPLWFPVMYRFIGGPFAPADDRALIVDLLDGAENEVLDVACGTGRFTRYIADKVTFVWGIDVSEGMLQRARRYADRKAIKNIAFARMEANNLRFESDVFDSVACCWALHLFPKMPDALAEMYRVLEPGGRFVGVTLSEKYVLAIPGIQEWMRRTLSAHTFDSEELRELLLETGFNAIKFDRRGAALFFKASG